MIAIDTDVISEPLKPFPNPKVVAWFRRQNSENLYITTTSLSELLFGVELLAEGRRKIGPAASLEGLVNRLFGRRILGFDEKSAVAYSQIVARARLNRVEISMS